MQNGNRAADRFRYSPEDRNFNFGFRLAMAKRPSVSTANKIRRDGRFIAYSDGTVLDTNTNLMWAEKDNGAGINWANAKSYCENYRGGGYTNWRMPTKDELAGLYDKKMRNRHGYPVTDLIEITRCCPWASEMHGSVAAYYGFVLGGYKYGFAHSLDASYSALPVRSDK